MRALEHALAWLALLLSVQAQEQAAPKSQGVQALRVGHWVEIKGELDPSGVFLGRELEVLPPNDKERITGRVELVMSRERFKLLGQSVRISEKTEWKDLELGDLDGARVRVEGRYRGPGNFSAREVALRKKGRDRIEGRVDEIFREGAQLRMRVMGLDVLVENDTPLDLEGPLELFELAPQRVINPQLGGGDEDDELPGTLQLGKDLSLGGQIGFESLRRANLDLDDDKARDREDYEASARLRLLWRPSSDFLAVLGARFVGDWRRDERDGNSNATESSINEAFVVWRDGLGSGWDVQLGRQDFDDEREWIYDQNLDALRIVHSTASHRLELSASTSLSDGSPFDQESVNLIGYLSNNSSSRHAAAWVVDRRNEDSLELHSTHYGARLLGEWMPQNESWLEIAGASGERDGESLSGLGFDIGTTWTPDAAGMPYLTLGLAYGGESFRQTGLQDDNDKLGGVTSYRIYGELFDPELANLSILTVGVGKRLSRSTSLDLLLHKYDQVQAADSLVRSDLRSKPDGVHTDLGWEADLVLGSRSIRSTHIEAVLGRFEPGDAFPGGDPAWVARLQIRFRF